MTRAPFVVGKSEQAFGKDFKVFDSAIGARFPNARLEKEFGADTMPQTADNLARDFQIAREDCDAYAIKSQQSYGKAKADGFFAGEIAAVTIPAKPRQARHRHRRGRASAPRDDTRWPQEAASAVRGRRHHRRQRVGHQ